jgi:hypothetical protein
MQYPGYCLQQEKGNKMKNTKKGNPNWHKGMQSANPYGRNGKPSFMLLVGKGLENFLSSPFNK